MPRGRPSKPLEVSRGTREELESLAGSRSLPAGLVRRAEIVLPCAEGMSNKKVAERVRAGRRTVGKWRERFWTQGLMGLYDERRPGRPRSIGDGPVRGRPSTADPRHRLPLAHARLTLTRFTAMEPAKNLWGEEYRTSLLTLSGGEKT